MIHDIEDFEDGATIDAQVGIVGSGLAGLDAARLLAREGLRVVVLESGRREFDPEIQELARVDSIGKPLRTPDPEGPHNPYLPRTFRGVGRLRQLGGTANIWTGKWREFDALDFEARAWVPASGWPLSLEDLRPIYPGIERDYGFGDFQAFADSDDYGRLCTETAAAGLQPGFHYWEGRTMRPAQRYRAELEASPYRQIVLGASVTELLLDESGGRVETVFCRSLGGRRMALAADHVVIATGGLEAPRLLLASNTRFPEGIGNSRGLVGRYFMDHPKVKGGKLHPGRNFGLIPGGAAIFPRPHLRPLARGAAPPVAPEPRGVPLPRRWLRRCRNAGPERRVARARHQAAALDRGRTGGLARRLSWRGEKEAHAPERCGPRRLQGGVLRRAEPQPREPCLSQRSPRCTRHAAACRRLALHRTGLPILRHDPARAEKALEASGIGRLDFGATPPDLDDTTDANHPMGATRMAATPAAGVVDRDCKVFGVQNLFIASSSVFPTGHSVAPTLTIIALSRRVCARILKLSAPAVVNRRMTYAVAR